MNPSPGSGAGHSDADEVIAARYFNGMPNPNFLRYSSLPRPMRDLRLPPLPAVPHRGRVRLWEASPPFHAEQHPAWASTTHVGGGDRPLVLTAHKAV